MRLIQPLRYQVPIRKTTENLSTREEHENDLSSELMDVAEAHL